MVYFGYSRAVYVPAHPLLRGHDRQGGRGYFFLKKFFLYVILKLCTKFQLFQLFPTMPATGQKVCGVVVWWWCGGGGGGLSLF